MNRAECGDWTAGAPGGPGFARTRFRTKSRRGPATGGWVADSAARLGISESAVKSAIYKLRQRYGAVLRAEIAQTVERPEEVDDEIRCLLQALRGNSAA